MSRNKLAPVLHQLVFRNDAAALEVVLQTEQHDLEEKGCDILVQFASPCSADNHVRVCRLARQHSAPFGRSARSRAGSCVEIR